MASAWSACDSKCLVKAWAPLIVASFSSWSYASLFAEVLLRCNWSALLTISCMSWNSYCWKRLTCFCFLILCETFLTLKFSILRLAVATLLPTDKWSLAANEEVLWLIRLLSSLLFLLSCKFEWAYPCRCCSMLLFAVPPSSSLFSYSIWA